LLLSSSYSASSSIPSPHVLILAISADLEEALALACDPVSISSRFFEALLGGPRPSQAAALAGIIFITDDQV
jgi:hypothetical protein